MIIWINPHDKFYTYCYVNQWFDDGAIRNRRHTLHYFLKRSNRNSAETAMSENQWTLLQLRCRWISWDFFILFVFVSITELLWITTLRRTNVHNAGKFALECAKFIKQCCVFHTTDLPLWKSTQIRAFLAMYMYNVDTRNSERQREKKGAEVSKPRCSFDIHNPIQNVI